MNYLKHSLLAIFSTCMLGMSATIADELSAPLEGIWKATASTDSGDKHYTITITKDGESLGGTIVEDGKDDGRKLDRVKVDGKKVSIEIDIESDGQTGIVKVAAEEKKAGTLTGKWAVTDSSGTALMGGEWEGTKEVPASLAGTWDTAADLPEGGKLESVLTIKGNPGKYSGEFQSEENGTNKIKKFVDESESVTMDVVIEREGISMNVQIKSKVDGNDLVGSWHLLDANGDEAASGDWKATKRQEFALEGSWNIVAVKPDGDEIHATFDISKKDDGFTGKAKLGDGATDLRSITVAEDGAVTIALGYEEDGTPGLATISAKPDGNNTLIGKWAFVSSDGTENLDGDWSASRATEKRGVLRGR